VVTITTHIAVGNMRNTNAVSASSMSVMSGVNITATMTTASAYLQR
jgi:hypothetical protein